MNSIQLKKIDENEVLHTTTGRSKYRYVILYLDAGTILLCSAIDTPKGPDRFVTLMNLAAPSYSVGGTTYNLAEKPCDIYVLVDTATTLQQLTAQDTEFFTYDDNVKSTVVYCVDPFIPGSGDTEDFIEVKLAYDADWGYGLTGKGDELVLFCTDLGFHGLGVVSKSRTAVLLSWREVNDIGGGCINIIPNSRIRRVWKICGGHKGRRISMHNLLRSKATFVTTAVAPKRQVLVKT